MQYTRRTTNDQPALRRRIAATTMAIGVTVFGVAVAPGVASAHHPILSGTTSCRTDAWTVTWTATADADRNLTWRITSPSDYSPGGFQDDQTAFTRTATYPGTQASAAETVTAEWSNSSTASATATVDRPPLCEVATTTTTTTTTTTLPETTTTTTIAPETTTSIAEDDSTTTTTPLATTTSVSQAGPTSTVGQSAATSTTTVGGSGQLPATGSGSLNLTVIALTLIGIGAVMLRLSSKPAR